jgi:hypothetical protein
MDFFPKDYTPSTSQGQYVKFSKLELAKEFKFRILTKAIIGYSCWVEIDGKNSPFRSKIRLEGVDLPAGIKPDVNGKKQMKEFYAFVIWDYAEGQVKILESDKATINKSIYDEK